MTVKKVMYAAAIAFGVWGPAGIQSANAIDRFISVGQGNTILLAAADTFSIDLTANHSYACDGIPESMASNLDWSTDVQGTTGGTPEAITARLAGGINPQITGDAGDSTDNRITFTPTTSDRFQLTVASAAGGGESVRIRCFDTTLYGGFNTNVNDFNFLELTNISSAQIGGKIYAVNFDGTVAINGAAFTVEPNRRLDIDLHTPAGADKYGLVYVSHNGPFGSLKGTVSQYTGTVSNFNLTGTIPLTPIEQAP